MNVFRQRINCLYADGVAEVRAAGVELSPADYAWLWDLSRAAVDLGRDVPEILSLPVMVGKLALKPVTLGGILWWRMASTWFDEGVETILAMAWLLAHADEAEAFRRAGTRLRARTAVWWWAARLPMGLTVERLAEGVTLAMGRRDGEMVDLPAPGAPAGRERPTVNDFGKFVIRLCAQQKTTPEAVLFGGAAADAYALGAVDPQGNVADDGGSTEYLAYRAAIDWLKSGKADPK